MSDQQYTWIPFYKEFAIKLLQFKNRNSRDELIEIMNKINSDFGNQYGSNGARKFSATGEIIDIDPFTVFNYINSWGIPKRRLLLKEISLLFNISSTLKENEEFKGVPSSNSKKFCLFGFDDDGINHTIPLLWSMFDASFKYTSEKNDENKRNLADLFDSCVSQPQVGPTYLTEILFCMQPDFFLPFDKQTRPALHNLNYVNDIVIQFVDTNLKKKYKQKKHSEEFKYSDNISGETFLSLCELCSNQNPPIIFSELSYKAWLNNQDGKEDKKPQNSPDNTEVHQMLPLNTILYGPPGTGKTYHTAIYAVAIIEKKPLDEIKKWPYEKVMEKYKDYYKIGRIKFTTFHQSYGYEDFIEGIRPVLTEESEDENDNTTDIRYKMKPGVFKAFCLGASVPVLRKAVNEKINANSKIWKVSLEGTGSNDTRTECMNNDHIRIGWDEYGKNPDLNNLPSIEGWKEGFGKTVLNAFINRMKEGDIVFSCYSAYTIDAIGVVTGDADWDDSYEHFKRFRKVEWLIKGLNYDITEINGGKSMTLSTVYSLNNITVDDVLKILQEYNLSLVDAEEEKPNYVFIIDEINRGNISKIFGELITLIEPSKRSGKPECIPAILPYSQKPFSIPDNVYILGTMNTADRSIALLDTALRRRFDFIEMMPDPQVEYLKGVEIEGLNISKMLTNLNKKIEVLFDREHTIGHAYFKSIEEEPTIKHLGNIFINKIIPLLQEYFYDDYEKIRLVLGDNKTTDENIMFIVVKDTEADMTTLFGQTDLDLSEYQTYELNTDAFYNIESYKKI